MDYGSWPIGIIVFIVLLLQVVFRIDLTWLGLGFAVLSLSVFFGTQLAKHIIDLKIALKIEEHFKRNPEKFRLHGLLLKKIVQNLVNNLSSCIESSKKECKIALYNVDYEGIKVIKKPTRLRKYYIVVLNSRRSKS